MTAKQEYRVQYMGFSITVTEAVGEGETLAIAHADRGDGWLEFDVVRSKDGVTGEPTRVRLEGPALKTGSGRPE